MRKIFIVIAVLTVLTPAAVAVLDACGAKFLVNTRSAKNQRLQRALRPANILVYRHSDAAEVIEFTTRLEAMLEGVGHTVTIAAGQRALQEETRSKDFGLVMIQLEEARRLRSDIASIEPNAGILPVSELLTRPEAARAKKEFGRVLTVPTRESDLLAIVQSAAR